MDESRLSTKPKFVGNVWINKIKQNEERKSEREEVTGQVCLTERERIEVE